MSRPYSPKLLPIVFCILLAAFPYRLGQAQEVPFSWENAVIYFVMTDRFNNGEPANDHSYGRGYDGVGEEYAFDTRGHFHGGDFAGITAKINEGYFTDLGVSAIWISPPFEQIHGWLGVDHGETQMYGYHGYWIQDFTELDANFGTRDEFRAMIDAAHAQDIRVIVDVVLNHVGMPTLFDADELELNVTDSLWRAWRPGPDENWETASKFFADSGVMATNGDSSTGSVQGWQGWWGSEWVRADLPEYPACGNNEISGCLYGLPDIQTDSSTPVDLPPVLLNKWPEAKVTAERKELNAFFARTGYPRTPRNYLIKWLTDWVREFGIDGFRLDTVKHVEPPVWADLVSEARFALETYRREHEIVSDLPFWAVGEIFGYAAGSSTGYDATGIDAFINFEIQYKDLSDPVVADSLYSAYAMHLIDPSLPSFLSYLSSHDVASPSGSMLPSEIAAFMMLPGPLQVYYGEESGRNMPSGGSSMSDLRSFMNWDSVDEELKDLWEMLGQFRNRHPAIGGGEHVKLLDSPYAFSRQLDFGQYRDAVVVVFGAKGRVRLNVSREFPDDALVRDAVTGKSAVVSFGMISLPADESGLMLIELAD